MSEHRSMNRTVHVSITAQPFGTLSVRGASILNVSYRRVVWPGAAPQISVREGGAESQTAGLDEWVRASQSTLRSWFEENPFDE